ncbi:MAG: phage tail protein [Paracoccaceae bacterium]
MPRRDTDPFGNYNFIVEIDGLEIAAFAEVSGLSSETEVIEYRDGTDKVNAVRKLPGLTKYSNITLKRGITASDDLWQWRKAIIDGNIDRRTASIVILNEAHEPVMRWLVLEAWPCKYDGPALNAKGNEVAIESLTLACERIELN